MVLLDPNGCLKVLFVWRLIVYFILGVGAKVRYKRVIMGEKWVVSSRFNSGRGHIIYHSVFM